MNTPYLLILYYSQTHSVANMAHIIANGVDSIDGIEARLRTVPNISTLPESTADDIPEEGPPYATLDDLSNASGLALGSPTRFGNMAAPLKYFIDQTGGLWQSQALANKPAGCFTSTSGMHSGQETTLTSMITPLLHHGALIVGIPYSETALQNTNSGGTPYGPSHIASESIGDTITPDERTLCFAFGKRLATIALKLKDLT